MAKTKKTATRRTAAPRKAPTGRKAAKTVKKAARKAPAPQPRTLTPYLAVSDAAGAIAWYKRAFGAKEVSRQDAGGGKLMHAELRIGDSTLLLSDIFPGADVQDPSRVGPSVTLHLWHRDVDKLWRQAVENGAKVTMPLDDQFWGDRYGKLLDPYGHSWSLSHRSKLSQKELDAKRQEAMKQFAAMSPPPG